jgi:hypothetical protein
MMTFSITTISHVGDGAEGSVEKANATLNKTIKMRYDTQVYNYTLLATATGMCQE